MPRPPMAESASAPSVRLIDEHAAASLLGLSVKTLRRWRWSGGGPSYVKLGRCVRYDPAEIGAFIELRRRHSTSEAAA